MMLIMGGNPAENHPCGFKWAIEAKKVRNAKMIVVDPRFTRTAATADLFLQIRAGADIAFLGAMIKYAIDNDRLAKDYLVNYTNASFIVKEGFKLPDDGLYSGFNPTTRSTTSRPGTTRRAATSAQGGSGGRSGAPAGRRPRHRDAPARTPRLPAPSRAVVAATAGAAPHPPACRPTSLTTCRSSIPAASSSCSSSSTRATRRRWSSGSPAFPRTNS